MRGKKTFSKIPHHSRVGGFVEGVEVKPETWEEIEATTGPLSAAERDCVVDMLDHAKMMMDDQATPSGDVVATLEAIARLNDPAELELALKTCDASSRAYLNWALYRMDGPEFFKAHPRPAKIKAAAWLAQQIIPKRKGERPAKVWRKPLGRFVLELCAARKLSTSASHGMSVSPAVRLLHTMMRIVDPYPVAESAASKILLEVRRENSA